MNGSIVIRLSRSVPTKKVGLLFTGDLSGKILHAASYNFRCLPCQNEAGICVRASARSRRSSYRDPGYRFPSEIISCAIWAYHRFCLSFRDVEDLLAERGILISYETIRLWCQKFGADYVRKLKRLQGRLGDHWHLDEVFLRINGHWQYLWRATDQDCDVIDILVQPRRDRRAAERFFRWLLRGQGQKPLCIITDRLRSSSAAIRTSFCHVAHTTERYANNRMEAAHRPTRQRERQMRRFNSASQAQRFISLHGAVHNLFRLGRH